MRTIYVADDGTEFESEEKCREYEKKITDIFSEFGYSIHAYDDDGDAIELDDDPENWEDSFQKIVYVKFDSQKAIDVFIEHAIHEYGLCDIEHDIKKKVKVGERYFYDWDKDTWRSLDSILEYYAELAEIFEQ